MDVFGYFCDPRCSALSAIFVGLSSVVGVLCDSVVQSLISLSGYSRFDLSSVCVGSLVVLGIYLLVASMLTGSSL